MRKILIVLVMALLFIGTVSAAGLSVQLKRTNPGIAGEKSAELIFDVVNTDLTHKVEGFLLCKSPDDAVVSSTLGVGTGAAQYVSPLFTMDTGPSQKAMSLTLESDNSGDKRTGCTIKYIPFKDSVEGEVEDVKDISYTGDVDTLGTDVEGFVVTLNSFTAAVEAKEATDTEEAVEAKAAKVELDVDGTAKEVEVSKSATFGALTITVDSADAEKATVTVKGKKTTTIQGTSTKAYQKMNAKYVTTVEDGDYRELRLDKTVPFVKKMKDPQCPEGKSTCKSNEVVDIGGMGVPVWAIVVGVLVIILLIAYLLGKSSK